MLVLFVPIYIYTVMGLPRIIILVIASRTETIHEQLLTSYWVPFIRYVVPRYKMVKVRLVFGARTPISDLGDIRDSIILGGSPDSYIPGILKKTIDAFAVLLKEPFDFIVRTNLSSFFILENLVRRLSRFRRTKLYNGIRIPPLTRDHLVEGLSFSGQKSSEELRRLGKDALHCLSGACIIFSKDVIAALVLNRRRLRYDIIDDVAIGMFLDGKVLLSRGHRLDAYTCARSISDLHGADKVLAKHPHYHIRVRCYGPRDYEPTVMRHLLRKVYGV